MSAPSEVGYALHEAGIGDSDDGGGFGSGCWGNSGVQKIGEQDSPQTDTDFYPFPRPPKTGYFYYKLPPKFSEWNVRTIAVLDLYNVDEEYLSNIFDEGIKKMLHLERLSGEAACSILENYGTENIREFAQEILEEVVQEYVLKIISADPPIIAYNKNIKSTE